MYKMKKVFHRSKYLNHWDLLNDIEDWLDENEDVIEMVEITINPD